MSGFNLDIRSNGELKNMKSKVSSDSKGNLRIVCNLLDGNMPTVPDINYIDYSGKSIGDEVTYNHSLYGDIPFIIIGRNHDTSDSVTLLTKNIVRLLPFDAKEASNTDSNRKSNGNNRYKYSNLLQWMNSDKAAGEWYTAQHSADAPPIEANVWSNHNPYANIDGLLKGFGPELTDKLAIVDKTTALCSTDGGGSEVVSSKIFLLSTTEVGLANENNIAEGSIYEYFSSNNTDARRIAYPSTYCLNNTGGYTNGNLTTSNGWHYWLRTPYYSISYDVRYVNSSGALNNFNAYYGYHGLRFGLCIKTA